MKRFLFFLLIFVSLYSEAQVYNNEWIDYSKTYYKFKIGNTGLYRISQATLATLGLDSTPVQNFQLWRNGKEIPLYTSIQTGTMGASDYLEFWGRMNDGKPDNALYRLPDFQLSDKWSLQTDTAAFFLTVNPTGNTFRLVPTANNITGSQTPEPYFMYVAGMYWKTQINPGYAALVGDYLYSSAYDQGEGWTSANFDSAQVLSTSQTNLYTYTGSGAPQSTFKINASGNALNARNFQVNINGTPILTQEMDFFNYIKAVTPFNTSLINGGTATVNIINNASASPDRMVVAQYEIVYPRQFNFGGASSFIFELPANGNGDYLEVSNFNYGGIAPVLYDLTNGNRYVGDISNPSLIKLSLLPSSVTRTLLLVSEAPANIQSVTTFQQKNFLNLTLAANQANYLIITNAALLNGSNGTHPVDDYKAYRSSSAGGGYNVSEYLIDELVDQFGLGIKMHPLSIQNFLRWARVNFSSPLKDVLLIGKGITYDQFRIYENDPNINKLFFVPTFGNPASDHMLSANPGSSVPLTPIGRLSVITGDEISIYLAKVKQYEQNQAFSSPLIADKAWMKNVVHVVGADDPVLSADLGNRMNNYAKIISDTLYGGNVTTFSKTSASAVEQLNSSSMENLFQQGIGLLTYFGHSSSSTLDFNLNSPSQYNNTGKYPMMMVMGCDAGDFFDYNIQRLSALETISEQYLLADQHGAIGFIASTSLSIVQYLDIYNTQTYKGFSTTEYGNTIGEVMSNSINQMFNITTQNDFYARLHCEQITLHGDPAIRVNNFAKPDYVIEDPLVVITPQFVSVAQTQFTVNAKFLNLGRAINKNIVVQVKRTYPDLSSAVIYRDTIPGIRYSDSITLNVPIVPTRDKGLNTITVTVDADNAVDELYETNNSITKNVVIYEDEASPVYPYNYAIINKQNIKLVASTANPFALLKQYMMELDTTALFNSSFLVTKTISSSGGVLEFSPGITFTDSTVYYWRIAPVPASGPPVWNEASFEYLANGNLGFGQSHYFQHLNSSTQRMTLDTTSRKWKFNTILNNLFILSGVFPSSFSQASGFAVQINNDLGSLINSVCGISNVVFNVLDSATFTPWYNGPSGSPGQYGSDPICGTTRAYNFQFNILDTNKRRKIVQFMDLIPDGDYVVVRNCSGTDSSSNTYASTWEGDTTYLGSGNTMYYRLLNQGFTSIDSFYRPRAWVFVYKKNRMNSFTPQFIFSQGIYDPINLSVNCITPDSLGFITSPQFGPVKAWKQLRWKGITQSSGDVANVDVIGIRNDSTQNTLFSGLNLFQQNFDISSINASTYPYIQLRMRSEDSIHFTSYQLKSWQLTCVPAPEGAIAPDIYYNFSDTVNVGQPLNFKVAFKNISDEPFDSMKVSMVVTDKNNVANVIPVLRRRPLPVGDTLQAGALINTAQFAGSNTLYIEVNPNNDQPEQYHFNNFAYQNFYVKPDSLSPLLDVTFDNVHILNDDIVSAKPDILIKLKDESQWLVLNDTSLLSIKVQYPDGSIHPYSFNNDTMQFIPAGQAPNPNNTATVNFRPYFPQDGEYQLMVTGKDRSSNAAGNIQYRVAFEIINKPMISNMLNYPNPFTTSTAFVFTITGSQVPQNIKIEIMTITGKIVKEITEDELGPLHIGTNITEYKWDGTDQFNQKVGNGIYLYRVVTNLNGKALDKYTADGDNTDKYFTKGYGKMYLMR